MRDASAQRGRGRTPVLTVSASYEAAGCAPGTTAGADANAWATLVADEATVSSVRRVDAEPGRALRRAATPWA